MIQLASQWVMKMKQTQKYEVLKEFESRSKVVTEQLNTHTV